MLFLFHVLSCCACERELFATSAFFVRAARPLFSLTFVPLACTPPRMREFTPQHKHNILTHYRVGVRGAGFDALARRFAVKGGGSLIRIWHARWDGTPASLAEQPRSGRPRILSRAEVSRHVRAPILAANRAHRAVHYTTLLPAVRAKTGKEVSVRTLRRYGKEQLQAKGKRSKKRTADESESTAAHERAQARLPVERAS
jgi:hypothetical protein